MFVVLSLASAVCYGAADFLGGLTSKRASTIPIVVLSQFSGLALLFIMLPLVPAATPSRLDHIWGAVAGLTGGVGVALLYRALSIGVMAVVAPTTAVCAVTIPVLAAVVTLGLTATACGESGSYRKTCDASSCTVKASGTKLTKRQKVLGAKMRVQDVTPDMVVHVEIGTSRGTVRAGETATVGGHKVTVVSATGGKGSKDDKVELKVVRA